MSTNEFPAVTVIGAGNIGAAVAQIAVKAGSATQVLARDLSKASAVSPSVSAGTIGDPITGDIVVLALPYSALGDVLAAYPDGFAGRIVVDPTNPIDFGTLDSIVADAGSSSAAELAKRLSGATVLKAFNTTLAATLAAGVTGGAPTTVLVAGDDAEAKAQLSSIIEAGGLRAVDAGPLKRAHALEAVGSVLIGLLITQQTAPTGGFALV